VVTKVQVTEEKRASRTRHWQMVSEWGHSERQGRKRGGVREKLKSEKISEGGGKNKELTKRAMLRKIEPRGRRVLYNCVQATIRHNASRKEVGGL